MAYDFKLVFHGLILLLFHGDDKETPTEVDALVVDTTSMEGEHRHFPYFSFSPADRAPGWKFPYQVVPGPDGTQFYRVSLEPEVRLQEPLLVTVDCDSAEPNKPGLTAKWAPGSHGPVPTSDAEQEWLDWVPSLKKANPDMPDPTGDVPWAGYNKDRVIARVQLRRGELCAAHIVRKKAGRFAAWEFKRAGEPDAFVTQAVANSVVLRLRGLTKPVWIKIGDKGYLLEAPPSRTEVVASVTSLPAVEPKSDSRLRHFSMYYDLAPWPGPRPAADTLNLPEHPGLLDTSIGTICPTGSGKP